MSTNVLAVIKTVGNAIMKGVVFFLSWFKEQIRKDSVIIKVLADMVAYYKLINAVQDVKNSPRPPVINVIKKPSHIKAKLNKKVHA